MANILLEQAFKALDEIQDEIDVTAKDLYESKDEIDLPKEITVNFEDFLPYGYEDMMISEEEYTEMLSDYLSDTYGYCHFGFDWEYGEEVGTVNVYNIKWDTSESLDKYIKEDAEEERVERIKQLKQLYDIEPGDLTADEIKELKDAGALEESKEELDLKTVIKVADDEVLDDTFGKDTAERKLAGAIKNEEHVCEKCGKEVCECDKNLTEGPNTTTTISVLDNDEKVIKQCGYTGLCKKVVNGKPVYTVKYAPGYSMGEIEAKNDAEATRIFNIKHCGLFEEKQDFEFDYYVVTYGNPYQARVLNDKESALSTAKSLNSVKDKLGEWEVYHYTKPVGGELTYEIIKEECESCNESDEVAREEYCVLVNGNNEECFEDEVEAIKFARERFADEGNDSVVKVLLVKYGPKDEHGDEVELGFEEVWASHFGESLKENRENPTPVEFRERISKIKTYQELKDYLSEYPELYLDSNGAGELSVWHTLGDEENAGDIVAIVDQFFDDWHKENYEESLKESKEELRNALEMEIAWCKNVLNNPNGRQAMDAKANYGKSYIKQVKSDLARFEKRLKELSESVKESKEEKLAIKYWVDEEHRDQGLSDIYFGEIKDLEDAKHIADNLFDEYASVEVVTGLDTDHEEVVYGRYPEEESLKEDIDLTSEDAYEYIQYKMSDNDRKELYKKHNGRYPKDMDEFWDWAEQYCPIDESLEEGLTKEEKEVSKEHKEEHTVCAKCGSEEVKFNDPETKEPLCDKCYQKKVEKQREEEKKSLEESITVNINDEAEVKKAKEEVEKSEKTADETEIIVDVDADSIEELKDSYVGNVILVCDDCLTPKFIKPELLKKDEETGLYNVGEACPHCGSEKGYKAEGQVAKASVDVDLEKTETTGASEPEVKEEEKVEVETKEPKLPSAMESKEEPSRLEKVDLNEQRFDRLVNKFVHSTYENVENYKTNNLYLDDDNSLIVEGVITYKSGKEKQAHFKLVEKKLSTTKEDVIALTGICEAFNTDEKAFTFRGNLKENKLDLNSLTYNFTTKVLNESKNIKGKVCIKY